MGDRAGDRYAQDRSKDPTADYLILGALVSLGALSCEGSESLMEIGNPFICRHISYPSGTVLSITQPLARTP